MQRTIGTQFMESDIMANTHFGFHMFANNHDYFLETDRKNVTDKVAFIFIREILANRMSRWQNATEQEKLDTIKNTKPRINPCSFEIKKTSTGAKYLAYNLLRHSNDENSRYGGGTIPEKYWVDEVTVFWEDDIEYL